MKKYIVVFLLLCILAGNSFAQLTFGGEAYAGVQIEKQYDQDETVSTTHRKEGAPKFNFTAAAVREDYGIKLDADFQTTNPFTLNGIYGWVYFLDKSINLAIGKISDAKWVSNLDTDNEVFFDKISGFRVEYKTPLAGLNVGAAFPANDFDFDRFAKKIILGASYVQPLLNSVIAYDMGNNGRFLFGFNYTGIDDLTAAGIEIRAVSLATWDSRVAGFGGELTIKEKVGYRVMLPLTVSLLAGQTFYGDPDAKAALFFTPSATYRVLPNLSASLSLKLSSADAFKTTDLAIKPCLEYTLKGLALLYVEYELKFTDMKHDNHRFGFGIDVKAF